MRPRGRKHRRTADAAAASGSAATWTPPRDEHPAVRTASPGGRSSGTTADTLAVSAGGSAPCGGHPGLDTRWGGGSAAAADPHAAACAHCRSRRACMDGRLPAAAMSPPCSGAAAVSAVDSGRPASTRPHSQTHRIHRRGVRFRGHLLGFRVRSAQPADIDGPDAWTADAACGHRQVAGVLRTPATAAGSCGPTVTARWTASGRAIHRHPQCRTRNGTGMCGIGRHRHGVTARSVVWGRLESQRHPGKGAQVRKAGR
jgi:hypothetical protein